jgi:hypothetical protein
MKKDIKYINSSRNNTKMSFISVYEQTFWLAYNELEVKNECTQTVFRRQFNKISKDLSEISVSQLYEIYFKENFPVFEKWFDYNQTTFECLIKVFLFLIHVNIDLTSDEIKLKIFENIINTILLNIEICSKNNNLNLKHYSISLRMLYIIVELIIDCFDIALQNVSFDRIEYVKFFMETLLKFDDSHVILNTTLLLRLIIKQLSFDEKTNLFSNSRYVNKLYVTIRNLYPATTNSDQKILILNSILNLFTSLTERSPKICETIVEDIGLDSFFLILKV